MSVTTSGKKKITTTTSATSVSVVVVVVAVVAVMSVLLTTAAALDASSSCQKTAEVFAKRIGASQDVPAAPVPGECRREFPQVDNNCNGLYMA
ncbi:hypothetical protein ElyMa_006457400 [Elysia marginata]|uniref:Uncharacterized protein n=1 Tax=Elysia marginata TaxID=1093978 RepID=A0AAV4HZC9_9GAST|nr:hypothetical protein ElyMa_006457400 [Elysia marginata]